MIVVLDTSAAMDVMQYAGEFEKYKDELEKAETVIAPEIYIAEIANVAWKYQKLTDLTHEQALKLAQDGISLVDYFIPTNEVWKESLREALNNDHPVYDCLYVICARRNDGVLLTRDKKLRRVCDELKVRHL